MSDDPIKAAEALAYQRGYRAGTRRKKADMTIARYEAAKLAFRRRAFLAALPSTLLMHGWKDGEGKPITSRNDRVNFAWNVADEALKRF